jgi:protein SCO1/2
VKRRGLLLAAAALTAGCDRAPSVAAGTFHGTDITGAEFGRRLALPDLDGRMRTLDDFKGKVTVLFFGYTQCPDVCPTTLADLASAVKRLGADSKRVQVLFVTVDPKRDTPELLREYVPAFDASFIGLRGDAASTERVTRDFHVYAQERRGATPDSYTVDHSAQSFVFDPQGRVRLVFGYGMKPEAMAADLRKLLDAA